MAHCDPGTTQKGHFWAKIQRLRKASCERFPRAVTSGAKAGGEEELGHGREAAAPAAKGRVQQVRAAGRQGGSGGPCPAERRGFV